MKKRNERDIKGFTLLEVIVVFVVATVVAAILVTFLGGKESVFLKSHEPKDNFIKSTDLNQVMANIRADYKPYPVWRPNHNYSATLPGDNVMPTAFSLGGQRYWYKCTTSGTSGSTEPDPWTTGTISDGANVKWTYQSALLTLSGLKNKIGSEDEINKKYDYDKSNRYGYYVIDNTWAYFDSSNNLIETTNTTNILKVTIGNDLREKITALFF